MAGDLLDRIVDEIRARMREVRGAYEESQQLERALAALDQDAPSAAPGRAATNRRRRQRQTKSTTDRTRRGANREAILAAVQERPGSTAREIADATGIARTTVASTLTRLATDGAVERSERPDGGVGFRRRSGPAAGDAVARTA